MSSLADRLSNEADQCRNDGAEDIAKLLDEAVSALAKSDVRRDLAWGRNAIAFIRERDLDQAFNDWCGGWPCPVDTSPATEIGRLVARILEIAPSAGLFAEIVIKPAPTPEPHHD